MTFRWYLSMFYGFFTKRADFHLLENRLFLSNDNFYRSIRSVTGSSNRFFTFTKNVTEVLPSITL